MLARCRVLSARSPALEAQSRLCAGPVSTFILLPCHWATNPSLHLGVPAAGAF